MSWSAILSVAAIVALSSSQATGQLPNGTGERLAKESMALVMFAGLGNFGALDLECAQTPFPQTDIDALVDREIVPVVRALFLADSKNGAGWPTAQADALFFQLKRMPQQREGGTLILLRVYEQKKREAKLAFGDAGQCAALSSMAQTGMHQKRLALRDIEALLR